MNKFEDELREFLYSQFGPEGIPDNCTHNGSPIIPRAAALLLEILPELRALVRQPIETAPRDGTEILGFMPSYYQGKGGTKTLCWMNFSDRPGWYGGIAEPHEPTHWMPIPSTTLTEKLKKAGVV